MHVETWFLSLQFLLLFFQQIANRAVQVILRAKMATVYRRTGYVMVMMIVGTPLMKVVALPNVQNVTASSVLSTTQA